MKLRVLDAGAAPADHWLAVHALARLLHRRLRSRRVALAGRRSIMLTSCVRSVDSTTPSTEMLKF